MEPFSPEIELIAKNVEAAVLLFIKDGMEILPGKSTCREITNSVHMRYDRMFEVYDHLTGRYFFIRYYFDRFSRPETWVAYHRGIIASSFPDMLPAHGQTEGRNENLWLAVAGVYRQAIEAPQGEKTSGDEIYARERFFSVTDEEIGAHIRNAA